jgi:RsiW-degrading membrane proteinase PrsW (M82 family)
MRADLEYFALTGAKNMFRKNNIRNSDQFPEKPYSPLEGFWFVIPLTATILLTNSLFGIPREPGNRALLVLIYAVTTLVAAVLLTPLDREFSRPSWWSLVRRCAIGAAIFLLVTLLDPQTRVLSAQLFLTAALLFLLLLAALAPVLTFAKHRTDARQIVVFTIIALLFAPIWLGPLAELSGNPPTMTNMIVGMSPFSVIATSMDFDYLRTSWFYQHSALGSLRYEYFSWSNYVLLLIALIAGCSFGVANGRFTRIAQPTRKRVTSS